MNVSCPCPWLGQEAVVEERLAARRRRLVVQLDQRLADAGQRREVATGLDLVVGGGDAGLLAADHLDHRLRIGEALQPALAQRVVGDDRHPALRRFLQRVQHARRVAAGIVAEHQDAFGLGEVVETDSADRHADALGQRHRGGLVAHVRAVRQVVVAVDPGEQRVQVARLVGAAAGAVEHRLLAILHGAQLAADLGDRGAPRHRHVLVASGVVAHRMGEPSGLLELAVVPGQQLGHGVAREEIRRAAMRGDLPGGRLRAVLAELERQRRRRLDPGAADALEAVDLVLARQRQRAAGQDAFLAQDIAERLRRAPSASRWQYRAC